MERKKILSLTALAVSVTFMLIVLGIRGGIFQSSLLDSDDTGSGKLTIDFNSGSTLKEFISDEERNLIYALLINGNEQQGVYFPRVYKLENGSTGKVAVAFRSKEFVSIEKKLSLKIKFPTKGIQYVGKELVTTEQYTATAKANYEEGILTVDIEPQGGSPLLLDKSIDNLLMLPFQVAVANLSETNELRLHIISALHTTFTGSEAGFPHFEAEGELHITAKSTASGTVLPNPVKKPFTGELTPPNRGTLTAPGQAVVLKNVPEVTQDKTSLFPNTVIEGTGDPIYVYISVKDKDGLKDMDRVTIDLSALGLAKENKLLEVGRTANYIEYTTNFALPNGVKTSATPYILTYKVYDKEAHMVSGSFSLMVTPAKKKIEVDLNNDGTVDIKDLTLYINAYQNAQAQ
ncbi:MAG: hypothetical protein ACK4NC_02715 [Candidatus Gracilibacteria bacterium]